VINLDRESLPILRRGKNLLAFSGGVDSSALLFLLLKEGIKFDIALVNYGLREQSNAEEQYALHLAQNYNFKAHIAKAPTFQSNFEKNARDFRYKFFQNIIQKYNYNTLITAHQLNDQLEWFLMRLTKGAGVLELLGLKNISYRDGYTLIRPILHHSKAELLNFLHHNGYKYFIDSSNSDPKYERNYFRKEFSNQLLAKYKAGVERSFKYLQEDSDILLSGYSELFQYRELYILEIKNPNIKVRVVDRYLKKLGYLLSSPQRDEVEKQNSLVVGGAFAVESIENRVYIAPYIKVKMPKSYKEACRIAKLPPKIRGYCYNIGVEPRNIVV
jgi:tRNA(Ile)-lysidine synthase